ncbi:MAG: DMT family transporter [Rhodobacterales bacterium]|nr:DMT family transporter [Rhodobacterales bacterium]
MPVTLAAPQRGILLMLAAILIFTGMDALAKGLIAQHPPLQVVWARYAGQAVILLVILAPRLAVHLRAHAPGALALRGLAQLGATGVFFAGLGHIGLAEATAIMDINPVLITLGAALFLGERLGLRRVLGVLAAMVGAMIVIRPGLGVFSPAALFPLAAAVCYAVHALITRATGGRDSLWTALLWTALIGTAVTSAGLPAVWQPLAPGALPGFLAIGAIGAMGQLCLIRAFALAEASALAPFGYVGLVFATLWGIVLFDEWPDVWTGAGAVVIVAAGVYVWHPERAVARRAATTAGAA